jgi:hypothetical protein
VRGDITVRGRDRADPGDPQLVHEAALQRAVGAFAASARQR